MFRQFYFIATLSCILNAQETVHHASVSGRIVDPSGAVISGAAVTARSVDTNIPQTSLTDREGRFRFAYLKIGPYEVKVRQLGFADSVRFLTLNTGGAYEIAFALTVGTAETKVTVESEATLLQAARSQIAGTVGENPAPLVRMR